jgi:hypothetical protein
MVTVFVSLISHTKGHCFVSAKYVNIRCLSLFSHTEGICFVSTKYVVSPCLYTWWVIQKAFFFVSIKCVDIWCMYGWWVIKSICVVSTKYGDSVCEPDESYRRKLFCFFRRRFIQIAEFWKATSSLHLWLIFQALYQLNQKQHIFKLSFQRNGTRTTTNQYVCI